MVRQNRRVHRTPEWWREAIVYQVYPRSYADANGDGIGDIAGIRSKVPYIKALGVDAIWLSPHYPSPMLDAGYDVADYRNVWSTFGTLEDIQGLIDDVHSAGMRMFIDIVPNHTSWDHPWFKEALAYPLENDPTVPAKARFAEDYNCAQVEFASAGEQGAGGRNRQAGGDREGHEVAARQFAEADSLLGSLHPHFKFGHASLSLGDEVAIVKLVGASGRGGMEYS